MRLFVFLVPLAWIGSMLGDERGIFIAMSAANLIAGLFALVWLRKLGDIAPPVANGSVT